MIKQGRILIFVFPQVGTFQHLKRQFIETLASLNRSADSGP